MPPRPSFTKVMRPPQASGRNSAGQWAWMNDDSSFPIGGRQLVTGPGMLADTTSSARTSLHDDWQTVQTGRMGRQQGAPSDPS